MILVDLNQVIISNLMVSVKRSDIDEDLIRHMVLNSLRSYKKKFGTKYGEIVVCCDSKNYWRRDIFPFYKKNRKKMRDKSKYDWSLIFNSITKIKDEMVANLPYKVVYVDKCEADDIIAVLAKKFSRNEKILILSSDKDFVQLQRYPGVEQYSPRSKQFLKIDDPVAYIKEHVILGDSGDGIPNIKSPDNVFVDPNARQATIQKAKLPHWINNEKEIWCTNDMLRNYDRNKTLIDFEYIPDNLIGEITKSYDEAPVGTRRELMNYFIAYKLKNLMSDLGDF